MREKRAPAPVSAILDTMFRGQPLEKRLQEGGVWLVWDEVVGHQIASKAHPVKLNDGVLTIHVASAPWLQQLTFLKEEIRGKINARLGKDMIREMYLKTGRLPKKESAAPPRPRRVASPGEREAVAANVRDIADADLRSSLESLFLRNLEEN